jgi:hypothetical protein
MRSREFVIENSELDEEISLSKYDPEVKKARDAAKQRWDNEMEKLRNDLTPEMVNDIREWRCEENQTWRGVATSFYDKYYDFSYAHSIDSGNQISGMMICGAAQDLLKQQNNEGWN